MNRHVFAHLLVVGAFVVGVSACGGDDDATSSSASGASQPAASPTVAPTEQPTVAPTDPPITAVPLVVTELPGGTTYLTGHIEGFFLDEGTLETDPDGVTSHSRDGTVRYQLVTDDPRVTGTVTGTWNSDRWGVLEDGAMMQWGTATLTNENGTWEGDYAGGFASPVGDIIARWWRGTGDYEGMTFYMWVDGSVPGVAVFNIGGIVFPSDPPPNVTP